MLKKHFFNLCIDDMAAYDRIKLLCVKKILTLHSVKVSSSPNSPRQKQSFADVLPNRCS